MGNFPFTVPVLGAKYKDYRSVVMGDSFNWSWVRPLSAARYLAIHHSAGPDNQTPQDIAAYHVQSRGWGGIGYHFCIGWDGTTYYVGDLTTARANVLNYNDLVIGICLIGNFTAGRNPNAEQIRSAHELCAQMLFRTPELSGINGWEDVVGHKQLSATACPGDNWDVWRAQIINFSGTPTPPAGGSPSDQNRVQEITNLYLTILGRSPDANGLNSYVNSNQTIDQIRKNMVESAEHQQILLHASNYNKILQITKLGQ